MVVFNRRRVYFFISGISTFVAPTFVAPIFVAPTFVSSTFVVFVSIYIINAFIFFYDRKDNTRDERLPAPAVFRR